MSEPALRYEKRGEIAYLTFNRPTVRNAMSPEVFCRLADAWQDYATDDSLRVAIITGTGERAFTAGADLGTFIPLLSGDRQPEDVWDRRVLEDDTLSDLAILRGFPLYKPIIAAINGFCLGAGTELIQATDLRIASAQASFGLTEVLRGFMPAGGSTVRLPRQIPLCKAMEVLLVGEHMTAQEAYRIGLVNDIVDPDQVLSRAEALAQKIAANGPVAVRKIKETVLQSLSLPLESGFQLEAENAKQVLATEDAKEGPRAFIEKRKPHYIGR